MWFKTVDVSHSARVLIGCKPIRSAQFLFPPVISALIINRSSTFAVISALIDLVCWEMVVNVMLYTLSSLITEIILEPVLYILQHKQPRLDYLTIEQFFSERTNALKNETRTKGTFSTPQV